jgi:hypothetical protein
MRIRFAKTVMLLAAGFIVHPVSAQESLLSS